MILPPEIKALLDGDGFTTRWLQERLLISRKEAIAMLKEAEAEQSSAKWTLRNRNRRIAGARKWNAPAEYVEPTQSRSIGRTTNRAGASE